MAEFALNKETEEKMQELFNLMAHHGLILVESELEEIIEASLNVVNAGKDKL